LTTPSGDVMCKTKARILRADIINEISDELKPMKGIPNIQKTWGETCGVGTFKTLGRRREVLVISCLEGSGRIREHEGGRKIPAQDKSIERVPIYSQSNLLIKDTGGYGAILLAKSEV